jgi:replicative DNA helicase
MATRQISLEHGLPASVEAERTILGAILLDNAAFHEAAEGLQFSDFALDSHRRIFGAMSGVLEDGSQIDIITLAEELERREELKTIGNRAYLFSLTENLPRRLSISDYIRIVKEKSQLRQLMGIYQTALAYLQDQDRPSAEIVADVQQGAMEIQAEDRVSSVKSAMEIMPSALESVLNPKINEAAILSTPLAGINDLTCGGIRRKEMWIFGARPSRGKTSFARQMAAHSAKRGVPTLVFTIEMPQEHWMMLTLAAECGIDTMRMRKTEYLNFVDRERLRNAAKDAETWPLYFEESGSIDIRSLLAKAKLAKMKHRIELIIVDYLQRVRGPEKERREVVGNVALHLAEFSKAEDVATILLSQLTPDGKDENARPNMGWLRESRDIEAHARAIFLAHRPKGDDGRWTGGDFLICDKQGYGPTGDIPVEFVGSLQVFRDRKTERES